MLDHYLYLSNVVLAVVCFLFAFVFITLPSVNAKQLSNYRNSLWILAASYCVVGSFIVVELTFKIITVDYISSVFIGISLSQAALFTITLDNLLNPKRITVFFVLKQCIPLLVFLGLHLILVPIFGYPLLLNAHIWKDNVLHPVVLLRQVYLVVYVLQIIYYTQLLFNEEKRYNQKIHDYSADTIDIQLTWVKYGYIFAVIVGLLSLITTLVSGVLFELFFNLILILFYSFFALRFIRYPYVFENIKNIFDAVENLSAEQSDAEALKTDAAKRHNWDEIKAQIIETRLHLQPGVTIDVIASNIGISRTVLSSLINSEETVNFNAWINSLRIIEAQRLLLSSEDTSLAEVAEKVGYTEQSNFSRQFKLHTQLSPSAWRQSVKQP